jgi:RNA polymerase sigma factor (sigma-70 family)
MAGSSLHNLRNEIYRMATLPADAELTDAELVPRVANQDRRAFEILVHRHGPLVWRVCRRVLARADRAEDAFQATFLVLASKAGSIRRPTSVASWLHGVAYRIARRALLDRALADALHEEPPAGNAADPGRAAAWRELAGIIEEEVAVLPDKLRGPILMCYWEGLTTEEAARKLVLPSGTIKSRLARARALLQRRLTRRGVTLPAGTIAVLLGPLAADASVPATLTAATTSIVTAVGTSKCGSAASVPSSAALLARSMLQSMLVAKVKAIVFAAAIMAVVAAGAVLAAIDRPATQLAGANAPRTPSAPQAPLTDEFGDPLPAGTLRRLGTTRFRPGSYVSSLAFLPGDKTLVSQGLEGIAFWDVATGKKASWIALPGARQLGQMRLSPDGKVLAAAHGERVQLWQVSGHKELGALPDRAHCMVFSHDGETLACVDSSQKTLRLWDWRKQAKKLTIATDQFQLQEIGFSHDDRVVFSLDLRELVSWDAASGGQILKIAYPNIGSTYLDRLALSPDGKLAARSIYRQPIRIYDTATGREVGQFPAGDVRVQSFTPDGKGLLVTGERGTALWDVSQGKEVYRTGGGVPAYSTDGKILAFCGESEGAISLYDAATAGRCGTLQATPGPPVCWPSPPTAAFSPAGPSAATSAFGTCARGNCGTSWDQTQWVILCSFLRRATCLPGETGTGASSCGIRTRQPGIVAGWLTRPSRRFRA